MKIKCLFNEGKFLPEELLKKRYLPQNKFWLTVGKTYIVYGIECWDGVICYLTEDASNLDWPFWYPADLFVIVDHIFSTTFYFNYAPTLYLKAISAYKELALTNHHHNNLIERESSDMHLFFKRQKEIDEASNDTHGWYYDYQPTSMKVVSINDTTQEPTQYQVYAIHVHNNVVRYLLELNQGHPNWYFADQFTLINTTQPINWYFNYTQKQGGLWGYQSLVLDTHHEQDLISGTSSALALFNEYKQKIYEWELACKK